MGIEARLAELQERQNDYRCNANLTIDGVKIREKTMTTLIAATGVGKSTINKRLLELATKQSIDAGEPGTETTRPRRADDGDSYRTDVSHDEMISKIENAEYPNWSVTPSGHIYATPPESLKAEYNFLPCLPSSLPMLRRAGFKAINAFYIVTTAAAWDSQIEDRKNLADFPGRIEEAKSSLEFAWNDRNLYKIFSAPGADELDRTAHLILDFVTTTPSQRFRLKNSVNQGGMYANFQQHSHEMYNWAFALSNTFEPPVA